MAESLDIELPDEVLPFSERPATLPAGLLSIDHVVVPTRILKFRPRQVMGHRDLPPAPPDHEVQSRGRRR